MKINSLKINNILSIEKASLTFGDAGLTLLEGWNYDNGRANGAGKSAIFNALSYALYDKVPRRITKSEILRKGEKAGSVHVEVATSSGRYGVKRGRPSILFFYKDDVEIDINQEEFERIIGLSYEQFLVTMYTAQDSPDKFINLNDSQKKAFILKIMNLGQFTKAKAEVSDQMKALKQKKEILQTKLDGLKSNVAIYKSSLVDPTDIKTKIDQNLKDIEFYNSQIIPLQSIQEPDLSKYIEVEEKIQTKVLAIQTAKATSQAKRVELKQLQNQTPDDQCPECNTDLNIINGSLHKASDQKVISTQISSVTNEINSLEDIIGKENEINQVIQKIKQKKQEDYSSYRDAQSSIHNYSSSINTKSIENTNLSSQVSKNDEIKLKVKDIVAKAKELNSDIATNNDELFLLETVGSIFDSTGAPAYVMDSIVDNFNDSVSNFISEIWPNATYKLQTYKTNKDKTIKAKFSESLNINGKEVSIGSLSGGELRALSLVLDFAIIDVLGTQYGLSLNPIILDEALNGLDSVGKELVMDLLVKLSETREIWVIDHSSEFKSNFSKIVTIEKRNGISKLV